MMKLQRICQDAREAGRRSLVPYFTAGYPDERTTLELIAACAARGCEVIELGVPFSDPVADGPVIQAASAEALARGMTLPRALDLVREFDGRVAAPVIMTYLNPVLRLGYEGFAAEARRAGCAGVIVPDLSLEESPELRAALASEGLTLVDLAAPTTPRSRLERLADVAAGFFYLVSVAGVTGTRSADARDLAAFTGRVRALSDLPLYVGFGIDSPTRAREAAACADGVIVGSAIMRRLLDAEDNEGPARVLELVDQLLAALMEPGASAGPSAPADQRRGTTDPSERTAS